MGMSCWCWGIQNRVLSHSTSRAQHQRQRNCVSVLVSMPACHVALALTGRPAVCVADASALDPFAPEYGADTWHAQSAAQAALASNKVGAVGWCSRHFATVRRMDDAHLVGTCGFVTALDKSCLWLHVGTLSAACFSTLDFTLSLSRAVHTCWLGGSTTPTSARTLPATGAGSKTLWIERIWLGVLAPEK